jgi:hypothetical protein
MVYVLDKQGTPLMPTERHGKAKHLLRSGMAKVVKGSPFTIQLTYYTTYYTQPVTLGIDAGYSTIGFSVVSTTKELISGECRLLTGQVERNKERLMYRRQRRSRLRYRAPRFDNRRKPKGWLAPSIQHKLDSHIRLVEKIKALVPVAEVIIEVANFDIQAIKNPGIKGTEYQQGEQYGYWNLREYILHRDNHRCQNPGCKNRAKHPALQLHHIGFWKGDRSDRPGNLITLCDKCHRPENHKEGKFLWDWHPKVKPFRAETFMSTVRWKLVNTLGCSHTYGYITKSRRIGLGLEKSYSNDAFVIAGGKDHPRCKPLLIEQVRRNNRSLEKFYDAKYIDIRTGEKVSGQELNCGRRTRDRELNGENLRKYRGLKTSKGHRNIRKQRYPIQPGDLVRWDNTVYVAKGVHCNGARVFLEENKKSVALTKISVIKYGKGLKIS